MLVYYGLQQPVAIAEVILQGITVFLPGGDGNLVERYRVNAALCVQSLGEGKSNNA